MDAKLTRKQTDRPSKECIMRDNLIQYFLTAPLKRKTGCRKLEHTHLYDKMSEFDFISII